MFLWTPKWILETCETEKYLVFKLVCCLLGPPFGETQGMCYEVRESQQGLRDP